MAKLQNCLVCEVVTSYTQSKHSNIQKNAIRVGGLDITYICVPLESHISKFVVSLERADYELKDGIILRYLIYDAESFLNRA